MGAPLLKNFCGCYSLRTGSFTAALFTVISSCYHLAISLTSYYKGNKVIAVLGSCFGLLLGFLLILGVRKRKLSFFLLWLVIFFISFILMTIILIGTAYALAYLGNEFSENLSVLWTLWSIGLCLFGIFVYLWLVVHSHYTEIKRENQEPMYFTILHNERHCPENSDKEMNAT